MKIILCHDVPRLGARGETVQVKDGFARNFLMPRGLAVPASASAQRQASAEQAVIQRRLSRERSAIDQLKINLEQRSVTIVAAAGADDKLFGSVTNAHIAAALEQDGCQVDKRKIELPEPLNACGVYHIPVRLAPEVTATLKVWVVKQ